MLINFDYDSRNACTILFLGHPELRDKWKFDTFTSLANSITHSIYIEPLAAEEVQTYIEGRVMACDGSVGLFTADAVKLFYDASSGIFRTAAHLSWRALIKAFEHKSPQIELDHVKPIINS